MSALAPTLQAFFTDRLVRQRNASPNTIAAYRDTLKLLLVFAAKRLRREPSQLDIGELDAAIIAAFLDHLEHERGNSISTRNARLAAIHSLFRYAAHRHPEHAQDIQRVLAIPIKRSDRALVTFLNSEEINALINAPARSTWTRRRDHALLVTAIQTGLRATELTSLNLADVHLGTGAHINCRGKGRKERITPVDRRTRRRPERSAIPDQPRTQAHPRWPRAPARQTPGDRRRALPSAEGQARHLAHAQAHRGDATAARRRRLHSHRLVVRT
jgi:integrase/recombinase XerD